LRRPQAEFVNDEQQRLLEIEDMRLVVKLGEKKRYSDQECQAIYQELVEAGLDDEARYNPDWRRAGPLGPVRPRWRLMEMSWRRPRGLFTARRRGFGRGEVGSTTPLS